jgi:hypothetical protein
VSLLHIVHVYLGVMTMCQSAVVNRTLWFRSALAAASGLNTCVPTGPTVRRPCHFNWPPLRPAAGPLSGPALVLASQASACVLPAGASLPGPRARGPLRSAPLPSLRLLPPAGRAMTRLRSPPCSHAAHSRSQHAAGTASLCKALLSCRARPSPASRHGVGPRLPSLAVSVGSYPAARLASRLPPSPCRPLPSAAISDSRHPIPHPAPVFCASTGCVAHRIPLESVIIPTLQCLARRQSPRNRTA